MTDVPNPVADAVDDAPERAWVLYLLECAGDRLYAGVTTDLAARFRAHRDGRGARFPRAFPPCRLVPPTWLPSRSAALRAEYRLKQQPRTAKVGFLAACGDPIADLAVD